MSELRDTVYINVEYNTEDEEYGPVYIATHDDFPLVTDGKTFEELLANLKEALLLVLEEDVRAEFNLVPNPNVIILMPLPDNFYT
ncbi:MAG: DUF1902 domain-containing protein [Anaerolineae bacterium]|nr:DUF1902 domain-containing protein [Anaerolineae bacterium]